MVTARGLADDYRLAHEMGADAYFIKPFSPLQLVNWLQEKLK
jgi:DNA-binding response OmpR family regulator